LRVVTITVFLKNINLNFDSVSWLFFIRRIKGVDNNQAEIDSVRINSNFFDLSVTERFNQFF